MTKEEFARYLYTYIYGISELKNPDSDLGALCDGYFDLFQTLSGIDMDLMDAFTVHAIRCEADEEYLGSLVDTILDLMSDGYKEDEMKELLAKYDEGLDDIYSVSDFYDYIYDSRNILKNVRIN